jgi:hypothetical protein
MKTGFNGKKGKIEQAGYSSRRSLVIRIKTEEEQKAAKERFILCLTLRFSRSRVDVKKLFFFSIFPIPKIRNFGFKDKIRYAFLRVSSIFPHFFKPSSVGQ